MPNLLREKQPGVAYISEFAGLGPGFRISVGTILEVFTFFNTYKVSLLNGPILLCTVIPDSGLGFIAPIGFKGYTVNTQVFVLYRPGSKYGYILGAIPPLVIIPGAYNPDELIAAANSGISIEPFYRVLFDRIKLGKTRLPYWWGAPRDLLEGDVGYISETGLGFFVSPFLAGLRANEYCGIWVNYLDSLLRLAGFNFQEWTGGSERAVMLDWTLVWGYEGLAASLYDQLGLRKQFDEIPGSVLLTPEEWTGLDSRKSNFEPIDLVEFKEQEQGGQNGEGQEDEGGEEGEGEEEAEKDEETKEREALTKDQVQDAIFRLPFHTYQRWFGSVAPGQQHFVFAPPGHPEAFSDNFIPRPLAHWGATLSGYLFFRSVNGILLAKYPYISAPTRILDVGEGAGALTEKQIDNAKEYVFRKDNDTPGKRYTTIRCNTIYDIHNFIANWEAQLGFNIFTKSFQYINESLQHSFADEKYPDEKDGLGFKRRSSSYIYLDPYGNISITNGAGSCIEMVGDTIRISAPGRVLIDSGNQIKLFSGHITQIAEFDITNIASKQVASYIVLRSQELSRRILAGHVLYESANKGYFLIPEGVISKIHTLNAGMVVARSVGQTESIRSHHFVLDDLNPITYIAYPVQPWAWYYQDKKGFDMSLLVIPERWNVQPSTIDTTQFVSIEPQPDDENFRKKHYSDIFKSEPQEVLLIKKSGINDYTTHL